MESLKVKIFDVFYSFSREKVRDSMTILMHIVWAIFIAWCLRCNGRYPAFLFIYLRTYQNLDTKLDWSYKTFLIINCILIQLISFFILFSHQLNHGHIYPYFIDTNVIFQTLRLQVIENMFSTLEVNVFDAIVTLVNHALCLTLATMTQRKKITILLIGFECCTLTFICSNSIAESAIWTKELGKVAKRSTTSNLTKSSRKVAEKRWRRGRRTLCNHSFCYFR